MLDLKFALIIQIFALLNPLDSFPFLMYAYKKKMDVGDIATKAVSVAFLIALIITFTGTYLFNVFGITLNSFRIAGGVVLLLLGISMVIPKHDEHIKSGKLHGLITLIASPLLTGPATISFITIKTYELGRLTVLANLMVVFVLVSIVFLSFVLMIKKINAALIDILSRILGLFLSAVAIELISEGITGMIRANF